MNNKLGKKGFSLTEVLLAVGTLAIGMLFIAGTFLVAVHFSTIATERTIAAVAADEAFAKIRIYDPNLAGLLPNRQTPLEIIPLKIYGTFFPTDEFAYPSTGTVAEKQYYWSALCRRVGADPNFVQVTVFVSRKAGFAAKYCVRDPLNWPQLVTGNRPVAVALSVSQGTKLFELVINDLNPSDGINEANFVNDGYTLIDDTTGQIYRVLERYQPPADNAIHLDKPWDGGSTGSVWVVPPPAGGGRYPCIAVYQRVIRF
jgi:type II secretory pathway pseudopilin PulG